MQLSSKHKPESGFTLIEVLVTMVILSIGLLGLAGLQANSMKSNHNAYLQSQATIMANDMADRMRANLEGVVANEYNNINGIPANPGCISADCSAAQLADYDAYEWNTMLADQLPSGAGTVVGNSRTFVITVRWDELRNGATGLGCNSAVATNLKCLAISVTLL